MVDESESTPVIRTDGVGGGGLHRLGPNYRPRGFVFGKQLERPGHVIPAPRKDWRRASLSFEVNSKPKLSLPPDSKRIRQGNQVKHKPLAGTALYPEKVIKAGIFDDDRMNDRGWLAAFPDPVARRNAIDDYCQRSRLVQSPDRKVAVPKQHIVAKVKKNESGENLSQTLPPISMPLSEPPGSPRSSSAKREPRIFNAAALIERPFWKSANNKADNAETSTHTGNSAFVTPKNANSALPSTKLVSGQVESVRQSSKGYLQERCEEVPSHYKKVSIIPAQPKRAQAIWNSDSDSEYSSDVYSDPDLRQGNLHRRHSSNDNRTQREASPTIGKSVDDAREKKSAMVTRYDRATESRRLHKPSIAEVRRLESFSHSDANQNVRVPIQGDQVFTQSSKRDAENIPSQEMEELLRSLQAAGLKVVDQDFSDIYDGSFDQLLEGPVQVSSRDSQLDGTCMDLSGKSDVGRHTESREFSDGHASMINGKRALKVNSTDVVSRGVLFTLKFQDISWAIFESDNPDELVDRVCRECNIGDGDVRRRIAEQIANKFKRSLAKLRGISQDLD